MFVFLALAIGGCSPDVHAVCKQGYQTVDVADTAGYADCVLCHSSNCSETPASNTICFPSSRSCAVCGTPTVAQIGPKYTLTITPQCLPSCTGDVHFSSPLYFVSSEVTIQGGPNLGNVIAKQCPLFIFQGSSTVTIDGLNITCETNTMCSTKTCPAPVLYFSETTRLTLNIGTKKLVQVSGNAKSAVLVDGGVFSAGKMNVDMTGSTIGSVLNTGNYRQEFEIVLGNYIGSVDAHTALKHTRIVLQPALPSAQFLYSAVQELVVMNYALYANTFGVVYEVMFDEQDIYGFMNLSEDYDTSMASLLGLVCIVLVIVVFFTINDIHDLSS